MIVARSFKEGLFCIRSITLGFCSTFTSFCKAFEKKSLFRGATKILKIYCYVASCHFQKCWIHTGSEWKEWLSKNQTKLCKNQMKPRVIYIWSNRGCTVNISQKLAAMPENIQFQNSKTTFKQNLTCISIKGNFIVRHPVVELQNAQPSYLPILLDIHMPWQPKVHKQGRRKVWKSGDASINWWAWSAPLPRLR